MAFAVFVALWWTWAAAEHCTAYFPGTWVQGACVLARRELYQLNGSVIIDTGRVIGGGALIQVDNATIFLGEFVNLTVKLSNHCCTTVSGSYTNVAIIHHASGGDIQHAISSATLYDSTFTADLSSACGAGQGVCTPSLQYSFTNITASGVSRLLIPVTRMCERRLSCGPIVAATVMNATVLGEGYFLDVQAAEICAANSSCRASLDIAVINSAFSQGSLPVRVNAMALCGTGVNIVGCACNVSLALENISLRGQRGTIPAVALTAAGLCGARQGGVITQGCRAGVFVSIRGLTVSSVVMPLVGRDITGVVLVDLLGLCARSYGVNTTEGVFAASKSCVARFHAVLEDATIQDTHLQSSAHVFRVIGDGLCGASRQQLYTVPDKRDNVTSIGCAPVVTIRVGHLTSIGSSFPSVYSGIVKSTFTGLCAFSVYHSQSTDCRPTVKVTMDDAIVSYTTGSTGLLEFSGLGLCAGSDQHAESYRCRPTVTSALWNSKQSYSTTCLIKFDLAAICGRGKAYFGADNSTSSNCNVTIYVHLGNISISDGTVDSQEASLHVVCEGLCGLGNDGCYTKNCSGAATFTFQAIEGRNISLNNGTSFITARGSGLCSYGQNMSVSVLCSLSAEYYISGLLLTDISGVNETFSPAVVWVEGQCSLSGYSSDSGLGRLTHYSMGHATSHECSATVSVRASNITVKTVFTFVMSIGVIIEGGCASSTSINFFIMRISAEGTCGVGQFVETMNCSTYTSVEMTDVAIINSSSVVALAMNSSGQCGLALYVGNSTNCQLYFYVSIRGVVLENIVRGGAAALDFDGVCAKASYTARGMKTEAKSWNCSAVLSVNILNIAARNSSIWPNIILLENNGACVSSNGLAYSEACKVSVGVLVDGVQLVNSTARGSEKGGCFRSNIIGTCSIATNAASSLNCRANGSISIANIVLPNFIADDSPIFIDQRGLCSSSVKMSSDSVNCSALFLVSVSQSSLTNMSSDGICFADFRSSGLCSYLGLATGSTSKGCNATSQLEVSNLKVEGGQCEGNTLFFEISEMCGSSSERCYASAPIKLQQISIDGLVTAIVNYQVLIEASSLCTKSSSCRSSVKVHLANSIFQRLKTGIFFNADSCGGGSVNCVPSLELAMDQISMSDIKGSDSGAVLTQNVNVLVANCSFNQCSSSSGSGGALWITGLSNTTNYIRITKTNFTRCGAALTGGAIASLSDLRPTIEDANFVECYSVAGGAVQGRVQFVRCTFINNKAKLGGAYQLLRGTSLDGDIRNCSFVNNSAEIGGAIHVSDGATLVIENSVLMSNSAVTGGSVLCEGSANSKCVFRQSNFSQSSAMQGGAIYTLMDTEIDGCNFFNNTAESKGGTVQAVRAIVNNSVFTSGRVSTGYGGGLYGDYLDISFTSFQDCMAREGGGVHGVTVIMQNVVFESCNSLANGGAVFASGSLYCAGCDVFGITSDKGAFSSVGLAKIEGSKFTSNTARMGGSILAKDVVLSTTIFNQSKASDEGGAVYAQRSLTATGVLCVQGNASLGGCFWSPIANLTDSKFFESRANVGAALYSLQGDVSIRGSSFNANIPRVGTLYVTGLLLIESSNFTFNTGSTDVAPNGAAAGYFEGLSQKHILLFGSDEVIGSSIVAVRSSVVLRSVQFTNAVGGVGSELAFAASNVTFVNIVFAYTGTGSARDKYLAAVVYDAATNMLSSGCRWNATLSGRLVGFLLESVPAIPPMICEVGGPSLVHYSSLPVSLYLNCTQGSRVVVSAINPASIDIEPGIPFSLQVNVLDAYNQLVDFHTEVTLRIMFKGTELARMDMMSSVVTFPSLVTLGVLLTADTASFLLEKKEKDVKSTDTTKDVKSSDTTVKLLDVKINHRLCSPGNGFLNMLCSQCEKGTYGVGQGYPCKNCSQVGMECATVGMSMPVSQDGYWITSNGDSEYTSIACPVKELCLRGNKCSQHQDVKSVVCSGCTDNYTPVHGICTMCNTNIALSVALALFGCLSYSVLMRQSASMPDASVRLTIEALQLSSMSLPIKDRAPIYQLPISLTSGSPILGGVFCSYPVPPILRFYTPTALFALSVVGLPILYTVEKLIKRKRFDKRISRILYTNALFSSAASWSTTLTLSVIEFFSCYKVVGLSKRVIHSEPSVNCYSAAWSFHASVLAVFWCVCFAGIAMVVGNLYLQLKVQVDRYEYWPMFFQAVQTPFNTPLPNKSIANRIRQTLSTWWIVILFLRRHIIAILCAIANNDNREPALYALPALTLSVIGASITRPYLKTLDCIVEVISLFMLITANFTVIISTNAVALYIPLSLMLIMHTLHYLMRFRHKIRCFNSGNKPVTPQTPTLQVSTDDLSLSSASIDSSMDSSMSTSPSNVSWTDSVITPSRTEVNEALDQYADSSFILTATSTDTIIDSSYSSG